MPHRRHVLRRDEAHRDPCSPSEEDLDRAWAPARRYILWSHDASQTFTLLLSTPTFENDPGRLPTDADTQWRRQARSKSATVRTRIELSPGTHRVLERPFRRSS